MITTDPSTLAALSVCYDKCIPPGMRLSVIIYALAQVAGLGSLTPSELANRARCYSKCIPPGMQPDVISYLLNEIASQQEQ